MATCGNDLQSYIASMIQIYDKLSFLKMDVPQAELIHLFLRGLHPIFLPLQLYVVLPGNLPDTFEKVVEIVRKFAIKPPVYAQLSKLKTSGLSQSMFVAVSEQESVALIKDKPICKKFSMSGSCNYGDKCKFSHVTTNLQTTISPKATTN